MTWSEQGQLLEDPDWPLRVHDADVGDEGEGEDLHAAVARRQHLVHGAHAWKGKKKKITYPL